LHKDNKNHLIKMQIQFIEAGGGLVQNDFGEYLLIYREKKWDLPKGIQEDGEELLHTALREVKEECGLDNLCQGPFIACTRHSYWREGRLIFKRTHWYRMRVSGRPPLCPQAEEGIAQCCWCSKEEVIWKLNESYPSVRWLFSKAFNASPK